MISRGASFIELRSASSFPVVLVAESFLVELVLSAEFIYLDVFLIEPSVIDFQLFPHFLVAFQ